MTKTVIQSITHDRLERWAARLTEEHSTPLLLIGAGHDHNLGQITLCVCEDSLADAALASLLRRVADMLEQPHEER